MSNIRDLPLKQLVDECKKQTEKFIKRLLSNPAYCFELFRRAFALQDGNAFSEVYLFYTPAVAKWAKAHGLFERSRYPAEDYASDVLFKAQHYLGGDQFKRKVSSLEAVLSYLRKTLNTEVLTQYRKQKNIIISEPDHETTGSSKNDPDRQPFVDQELYEHIFKLFPEKSDQRLIISRFLYQMKPSEIVEEFPEYWDDARQVSVCLYSIRKKLSQDPVLRSWAAQEIPDVRNK